MACPSLIYSDYPYGILWPVLLWFTLIMWYLMACPSLIYSDYPFGILWPVLLWFILINGILWPVLLWFILIIPLVSYGLSFFDLFWLSLVVSYGLSFFDLFWLEWYLMACPSLIYSDYPYGILWPVLLWFNLIIPLVSYGLSLFWFMAIRYLLIIRVSFGILWPVLLWFTQIKSWYLMDRPSLILWLSRIIFLIIPMVSYGLSFFDLFWLSHGILWPVLLWFILIIPWYLMACPDTIGIIRINQGRTGHKIPKG